MEFPLLYIMPLGIFFTTSNLICLLLNATMSPSISIPTNLFYTSQPNRRSILVSGASSPTGGFPVNEARNGDTSFEGTKERIKKLFDKVELSVSSYDTAWAAMVPFPSSPEVPCFPVCIKWLLTNQQQNGSWGLPHQRHPALTKDTLSSTLACVLALKRWGVGEQNIINGLQFIEANFASITDKNQQEPIGFDITFPGMIEHARDLNLNLPLRPTDVDAMLHRRDLELSRGNGSNSEGRKAYLAYVSEGLGKSQDWAMVLKYQRKNGSLFNSPSTTAAALTHLPNPAYLDYIQSLVNMSGDGVPAIYPLHLYSRLHMVDSLESLGIKHHFRNEIASVLDETHRCWLQGEEEIFLDTATCAMAFRILRDNGYEVSSDPLAKFAEEDYFFNTLEGYMKDTCAVLELYKASHMIIHPDESYLDQIQSWTSCFLKQESSSGSIQANNKLNKYISQEVDYALMFPFYANIPRLATTKNIEHYNVNGIRVLKTSYWSPSIGNKDFLKLAVEDFNVNQPLYLKEFKEFERWVVEQRLDKARFMKHKIGYCYYTAVGILPSPEISEARLAWAKHGILISAVDEWFDREVGYEKDKVKLVELVEKWDVNAGTDGCSEIVEIFFSALHSTVCENGITAYEAHGCDATNHIKKMWLDILKTMLKEAEWIRSGYVPTMDEYFAVANTSIALTPLVVPCLLFVGAKISQETLESPEFRHLVHLMSITGRLLNDVQTYQREADEGKQGNAVTLRVIHSNGMIKEEEAIEEINGVITEKRRELLRLVLQKRGSLVPRACKDVFWYMNKVMQLFYMEADGPYKKFLMKEMSAIVHEPIAIHQHLQGSRCSSLAPLS